MENIAETTRASARALTAPTSSALDACFSSARSTEPLTREQEAGLTARLAEGRRGVLETLVSLPAGRAALIDVVRLIQSGHLPLRETVNGGRSGQSELKRLAVQARALAEAGAAEADLDELYRLAERLDLRWAAIAQTAADVVREHADDHPPVARLAAELRAVERDTVEMVERNTRLVLSIARRYGNRNVPLVDLFQEGCLGLIRAVELFDPGRDCKFSTYATWWIRQRVSRAIVEQGRTIRLPHHVEDLLRHARQAARALGDEEHPDVADVAARLDVDAEQLRSTLAARRDALSLETPVGEDGRLGDLIADVDSVEPGAGVSRSEMVQQVNDALDVALTPREAEVIRLRFGLLDEGDGRTLEEIGSVYSVSRERIRQIEAQALDKLRRSAQGKALRAFLEG